MLHSKATLTALRNFSGLDGGKAYDAAVLHNAKVHLLRWMVARSIR